MKITLTLFLFAMAFKFTAIQKLPPVSYLTLMDKYILLGFSSMAVQCIGFWIVSRAQGEPSAEYDYYDSAQLGIWPGDTKAKIGSVTTSEQER
jgi:hypothetical protein